ncbi:MAG: glycoside hydrolase family 43 protein [Lachnospiraceae bacterium]|nr:glycoside hydrolase family 43 protein [Lachnospiraceae bacterium]
MDFNVDLSSIKTGSVNAVVSVHDPSIYKDNGYYIFGSHMTAAKSENLRTWEWVADGYVSDNKIYGGLYDAAEDAFRYAGRKTSHMPTDDGETHVWAPDVIYDKEMGKYLMYVSLSSTWNASEIAMLQCDTIDGKYEYVAPIVYSGVANADDIASTDIGGFVEPKEAEARYTVSGEYCFEKYPNAIDPTVFYDEDDRLWMVYGSWSGGIYLLELDPKTGLAIHPGSSVSESGVDAYYGKKLMGGGHKSIEGPYILYDEEAKAYYLFVSYGSLTAHGGYQIRVFKSDTVDGEYTDMNGKHPELEDQDHSPFGLKLSGNYRLPSLETAYMATGHNSAFIDDDGKRYVVYHTRFESKDEYHSPRAKQYFLNKEGWPCLLPYATNGETISENGYDTDEVVGRYYYINQGTSIDDEVAEPSIIYLTEDGKAVTEDGEGAWSMEPGSCYMSIQIGDAEYSGVFCKQVDEAGTPVMAFTAAGNNESVWGVKY